MTAYFVDGPKGHGVLIGFKVRHGRVCSLESGPGNARRLVLGFLQQ